MPLAAQEVSGFERVSSTIGVCRDGLGLLQKSLVVGFESGNPQILKNIKKGVTVEMARAVVKNCRKVGIVIHGDFVIGLPGETRESIERTIEFAKEFDTQTIQVSVAHAFPGTELYDYAEYVRANSPKPSMGAVSGAASGSKPDAHT